jgi:hypothetical protein
MTYVEALRIFRDNCEFAPGTTGNNMDDESDDE